MRGRKTIDGFPALGVLSTPDPSPLQCRISTRSSSRTSLRAASPLTGAPGSSSFPPLLPSPVKAQGAVPANPLPPQPPTSTTTRFPSGSNSVARASVMAVPVALSAAFSFDVAVVVVAVVEAVGGNSTPGRVACSAPSCKVAASAAAPDAAPVAVAADEARVSSLAAPRVDHSAPASLSCRLLPLLASLLSRLTSPFGRKLRPERCH